MKVIVTGASGHIGNVLVRELVQQGAEVIAIARHASTAPALNNLPIHCVDADITDTASLQPWFNHVDVVYHLAAKISLSDRADEDLYRINVEGTKNIAKISLQHGVKCMIFASSFTVYQQQPIHTPLNEQRAILKKMQHSAYAYSKILAENIIHDYIAKGLNAIIVNPSCVMGPYDFLPSAMGAGLLLSFRQKLPLMLNGGVDCVDVRDVAKTMVAAANKGKVGENYLLTGQWYSHAQIAKIAADCAQVKPPRFVISVKLLRCIYPLIKLLRPVLPKAFLITRESLINLSSNRKVEHTKAQQQLGHQVRPLQTTIQDTYQWLQQHDSYKP